MIEIKEEKVIEPEEVVIYTRAHCPFCWRAKRLLKRKGYPFEEVDVGGEETRIRLMEATGRKTVPLIFLSGHLVGGFKEVRALVRSGELDRLFGEEI